MCIYCTIIDSVIAHERGDCKMARERSMDDPSWSNPALERFVRKWKGRRGDKKISRLALLSCILDTLDAILQPTAR